MAHAGFTILCVSSMQPSGTVTIMGHTLNRKAHNRNIKLCLDTVPTQLCAGMPAVIIRRYCSDE